MSTYTVRPATPADAPTSTAHRRAMFTDIGETDSARLDAMATHFWPWVQGRLARDECLGWRRMILPQWWPARASG